MREYSNANVTMYRGDAERRVWKPTVMEETCQGRSVVDLRTKHFSNRKLFLTGEVTEEMADDFVAEL